jgi:hypothetical protein
MAEFLNQPALVDEVGPMSMMGKPLTPDVRATGFNHCRDIGLDAQKAFACVDAVANRLERDQPYEAMSAGMRYLDLTGTYRLFSALLCAAWAEHQRTA